MAATVLFVAGSALSAFGVARRVWRREPGSSLVEALWAPSHPQVAFAVGPVLVFAAAVLTS